MVADSTTPCLPMLVVLSTPLLVSTIPEAVFALAARTSESEGLVMDGEVAV